MVGCAMNCLLNHFHLQVKGVLDQLKEEFASIRRLQMRTSWFEKNLGRRYYQCLIRKVSKNDVSMKMYINGLNIFSCVTCAWL